MATILDFSFLANFSSLFTFLLVLVGSYALLSHVKFLGENAAIHGFIAFLVAIIVSIFPSTNRLVSSMAPWFVILAIFLMFLTVGYMLLGWSEKDLATKVKTTPAINWAIFIIGAIILIVSISNAFGPGLLNPEANQTIADTPDPTGITSGGSDFGNNVMAVFFSPKVLGMVLIMLVAVSAIAMLGGKTEATGTGGSGGGDHH